MLFIVFVLMNEVELLVHGREVTLEQQKAVHARVIWYVPCTYVYMYMYNCTLTPTSLHNNIVTRLNAAPEYGLHWILSVDL